MNKNYTKKFIVSFIVIALIAMTMVCCMAFILPKNEDISTTNAIATTSDSGKYPIISKSSVLIETQSSSESSKFTPFLYIESAEEFTYYIHINANVTGNYSFLPLEMQFGKSIDDNSSPTLQIIIKNRTEIGIYYVENLDDIYSQNYVFSYEANIFIEDNIFDYYLVLTNESISICYYKPTGGNGAIITPSKNKFEDALKNKAIEFYTGSEEYNSIINLFKNTDLFCYYYFTLGQNDEITNNFVMTQYYKKYVQFVIPPREGYTLKGLYYDEAFTQPYNGDPVKPLEELYQKWEINTYTVTFDWRDDDNWQYDTPISKTYKYGEEIDFVPEREYYGFIGWFDDATGEPFNGVVKSDLYLMGKWDKYNIIVTYLDTDLSVLNTEQIDIGGVAKWIPRKVGYKFKNWVLDGEIYNDFNTPLIKNTTLIANFEKIECVVTLFINNNVYKAYAVDYDLPLVDFLSEIGIDQRYIAKYAFTDLTGSNQPINDILVSKNMRIDVSDRYITISNIKEQVKANSKLITISMASICLLIIVSIFGAIFGKKKYKRKKRKQ